MPITIKHLSDEHLSEALSATDFSRIRVVGFIATGRAALIRVAALVNVGIERQTRSYLTGGNRLSSIPPYK